MNIRILLLLLINTGSTASGYILGSQNEINGLALQSDGKIIGAGSTIIDGVTKILVARYNSTGQLDSSFGNGGCCTTEVGDISNAYAVSVTSDSKILVAGSTVQHGISSIVIARYTTAGVLDATFGVNGIVITSIYSGCSAYDMAMQKDGKIVVVGSVLKDDQVYMQVVRYEEAGELDRSFGDSGVFVVLLADASIGYCVQIQPDDKILCAGLGAQQSFIVRCSSDGTLDKSFGSSGGTIISIGDSSSIQGIGLQRDGKIIVGGFSNGRCSLARLETDGTLDKSFGVDGISLYEFSDYNAALDLVVDVSDQIIIAGLSGRNPIAAYYTKDGVLDGSFGFKGITNVVCGTIGNTNAIALQDDGKIVCAGFMDNNALLVRLNKDGSFDGQFGMNGLLLDPTDFFTTCTTSTNAPDSAYVFAYDTTNQTNQIVNSYQNITFNTNGQLQNWSHSTGQSTFTCNKTGLYLVNYTTVSEKTSGSGLTTASFRVTRNNVEIPGSQLSFDYTTNTQTTTQSKTFLATFTEGDVLRMQYTSSNTASRLLAGDGQGTIKPSVAITICLVS